MSGCSTSASTEVQGHSHQDAVADCSNISKTSEHQPLQHENEVDKENRQDDGKGNGDAPEEEDEDEDADFNPSLKETNFPEASTSSLSSEVEDLDMDVADSRGNHCAFDNNSKGEDEDTMKDCHASGNVESGEEMVMQNAVSNLAYAVENNKESALNTQSENGELFSKENGPTSLTDVSNATDLGKPVVDLDTEDAICMRTRARYSLASFTLDELETFLQETDDEDDLQNVDDEEEYKKFLAGILRGDDSQNLQENANADDEDEENDADFELELEEALESEPEEVQEQRVRRNRSRKACLERNKRLSEPLNRPLRPLLPFASMGTFSSFEGNHFPPSTCPSSTVHVNNGYSYGFTPHQIGQLHCLIHEHVQLLIQVFSMSVLEPGKRSIASVIKELVVQMHQKRDEALTWRTVPHPSFCFFPPYIHPSVSDGPQKILPSNGSDKNVQQNFPCGSNRLLHSGINSISNERHIPDEREGSSQTPECTSWGPYVCGPVLSVMDVAPLRLVQNYIDDVSSAARAYERCQIELGFETHCQKEPLFPLRNPLCSTESDGQGEMENAENTPQDAGEMPSPSSNKKMPKKTMAATLLEKAKNQSIALVPKEIAKLAQRFWPLFNPALYPHKPPPAQIANRVLFTDAEDELLALGLMEYNTDWKAIQQRFLPCKSRHQIFVRQKNRASSKAPENPIKAVRRIKNSPLTSEEIARIEVGLKKFKLDWISIWSFFVPYRDPSLLPRQWRIASGTQKSYKSDANKKAKRRLYELRRKSSKPSPSNWHSSSDKEGDSTDNAIEETNSGDNHMDKEDEAYVHEAFLADWMPDNNFSSSFPARLPSGQGPQDRDLKHNSIYGDMQPPIFSKPPSALRSSHSQIVLRPYRARRPSAACLVKLAPDLPPVNLPPSVRVMSQSAFKSSQPITSVKSLSNASRVPGMVVGNRALPARIPLNSEIGSLSGHSKNSDNITHHQTDRCVVERGPSDLQLHPLLFQAPQDGDLRYYPNSSSTPSFSFFPGKQPQLSLSLFHNPRQIRDAVSFLGKSSKPSEQNASTTGADFHPLLQRDDDADYATAHRAGRLPSTAGSREKCAVIRNPSASTSKPSLDGTTTSASGTKFTSLSGKANELDLNFHLSFTSKNQEAADSRNTPVRAKYSSKKRKSVPDGISGEVDSGVIPLVTSTNDRSTEVSDNVQDESLPEIVMEQEELSDSEEEFGGNVEFECEEMADSEGDSTSDSEQVVNMPDKEVHLEETDADIDSGWVPNTQKDYGDNTCSTSDRHSTGLGITEEGIDIKPGAPSLNLNSCPPISPYSNPQNGAVGYEFGPFGTKGTLGSSWHIKPVPGHMQKRAKDDGSLPRKRVCRSNSNSNTGKGNKSSDVEMSVDNLKNVSRDD